MSSINHITDLYFYEQFLETIGPDASRIWLRSICSNRSRRQSLSNTPSRPPQVSTSTTPQCSTPIIPRPRRGSSPKLALSWTTTIDHRYKAGLAGMSHGQCRNHDNHAEPKEGRFDISSICSSRDQTTDFDRLSVTDRSIHLLEMSEDLRARRTEDEGKQVDSQSMPEIGLLFTDAAHLVLASIGSSFP